MVVVLTLTGGTIATYRVVLARITAIEHGGHVVAVVRHSPRQKLNPQSARHAFHC
jgi:hypothetical protein